VHRTPAVTGIIFALFALLASGAAAAELILTDALSTDAGKDSSICRWYVCDEAAETNLAYRQQLQGNPASLRTAVRWLGEVVRQDPASAPRWADFGDALAQSGEIARGRKCIDRAVELGGNSADVLEAAGEFHLRWGDRQQGLGYLSRTLAGCGKRVSSADPEKSTCAKRLYKRSPGNA
jgi:cytochrome c-type biogenesis protein CcmH/NrfG